MGIHKVKLETSANQWDPQPLMLYKDEVHLDFDSSGSEESSDDSIRDSIRKVYSKVPMHIFVDSDL